MVHPVPAPVSTKAELINNIMDTGSNQKLMLFNRGNRLRIVLSYKHGLCLHLDLKKGNRKGSKSRASRIVSEDPTL